LIVEYDNLLTAAQAYLGAKLCVLPALRAEKRPAVGQWKPYQDRLPSQAELTAWLANHPDAICLLCGRASGHMEMIDFDAGGELFNKWLDLLEERAPELMSRLVIEKSQRNGIHVIYRCVEPVCGNMKLAQRRGADGKIVTLIETRGEGGLFLCAPTAGYESLQGDLANPPVLTAEERDILLSAAWSLNEYMPPVADAPVRGVPLAQYLAQSPAPASSPSSRPGDDFNARGDMRDVLMRHGWTQARDGANEYWRRPGKSSGWSATLKDRVFYVFSSNAEPFAANQPYSPFALYTLLEHGGDYARSASALRGLGYGSSPASLSTVTTPAPADQPPAITSMQPLNVYELVSKHPELRRPVIHGLLREGETMNLISAPKMGKSWLVTDLALSIATGRDWLGQFRCERGDVLILDNELHGETSAHRIPKVANARGLEMDAYAAHVWVQNLRGCLQDVFSLGAYFQSLSPGRFKVIILDAFYRFMPRDMDENDNGTMSSLYNHIDRYADQLGCSFVLIHHSTKGNQSGKSVTDVGAGAGSQSRATDTHMILRAHEEEATVVLDAAVRSWPPCQPRCLRWAFPVWSPADDLDPKQLKSDSGKKKSEKKVDGWTAESFIETFVDHVPTIRTDVLARAADAGLSQWQADRLLRNAEKKGIVTRTGEGRRGQPYWYTRKIASSSHGEQP